MTDRPYVVTVIVDPNYGERLADLPLGRPVWIVDTPMNRLVTERLWAESADSSHLTGMTIFTWNAAAGREATLIDELDTVDLHHGVHSADPPYTVLEVVGTPLTQKIKDALSEFGFDEFDATAEGFRAVRPLRSRDP
jgi:hypothetical protein